MYKPGRPAKYDPSKPDSTRPPARPGEYRIRDDSGKIAYIGETNDLRRRTGEHLNTGKLGSGRTLEYKVADGRSTSQTRRVHEREKIGKHNPFMNKSSGGEGRPAKK